jgi:uncharacterized membrane protein
VVAVSRGVEVFLVVLLVVGASVWVGGYLTIAVVASVARRTLGAGDRVAFFRALGRSFGPFAGAALAVALMAGGTLALQNGWSGVLTAATVVAAAVVLVTVVGVVQARRMTQLRQRLLRQPDDGSLADVVRRGARNAAVLRGAIGLLTLALVVLGAVLAT